MHIDRCMVNLLFIREDPLGRAQGGGTRATETARNPSPSGSRRGPSAPGEILSPPPSSLPPSPLPNPQVGPSIPHLPPCRPVVLISSIPPCPPPLKWVLCSVLPVVFRCHYSCVPVVFHRRRWFVQLYLSKATFAKHMVGQTNSVCVRAERSALLQYDIRTKQNK
jgi:hypothetical protein